jgi:hypothetical protein
MENQDTPDPTIDQAELDVVENMAYVAEIGRITQTETRALVSNTLRHAAFLLRRHIPAFLITAVAVAGAGHAWPEYAFALTSLPVGIVIVALALGWQAALRLQLELARNPPFDPDADDGDDADA